MGSYLRGGGPIDLETTMVSVLHKELKCKVEKPKYKKFQVMQLRINREGEGGLSRQGAYELSSPEKGGGDNNIRGRGLI